MFRFLHAADIHLDSPLVGLQCEPDSPAEVLRGATRRALQNMVRLAIDEEPSTMISAPLIRNTKPIINRIISINMLSFI